jgi:hypothetical protein
MISPSKTHRSRHTKKGKRPQKTHCALVFTFLEMFAVPQWSARQLRLIAKRAVALWNMSSSRREFLELYEDYWQLRYDTGRFCSIDRFLKWRAQA